MNKTLILFDFDGTVIDNSEGIFNCIHYAADKMGLPHLSSEILKKFVGPSLFDGYMHYYRNNPSEAEEFVRLYRERYAPIGHSEAVLYPDIEKVLLALKQKGYHIAVCSGKPYEFVKKITVLFHLDTVFEALFCPGFATHNSTKEDNILAAMRFFGVTPDETVMVGDTLFDVRSAKNTGVEALGVTYGFSEPHELENEGADYLADTPVQLYTLITGESL